VPDPLPQRLLYAEPLRRRMRVRFGGRWIADSEHVLLLFEPRRYPMAYFPEADISPESRVDEAIRLLRAASSFGYAGKLADTYVAAGPAHLALARLLEAQDDRSGALDSYRQFLRRVDLPSAAQRASVKEAETAVARLSPASAR